MPRDPDLIARLRLAAAELQAAGLWPAAAQTCRDAAQRLQQLTEPRTELTYDDDLVGPSLCHCGRLITHGPCRFTADTCPFEG